MNRIVSLVLLSVGALFLLVTLLSSFFPSHVRVSRAIDIQRESTLVNGVLQNPSYWKAVLPAGTQFSTQKSTDSTCHILIQHTAAIQMAAGYQVFSAANGAACSVQRYYDFYFDWYPWEKFSSLLLESKFGLVLENELQQLKWKASQ